MSDTNAAPAIDMLLRLDFEVDPVLTLAEHRHGPRDPTIRFEQAVVWRASRFRVWSSHGPDHASVGWLARDGLG